MIEIINQVTELMNPLMRVNDRTIYFADIYVGIEKKEERKNSKQETYIYHSYRIKELKGQCFEKKPLESGKKFFHGHIKHQVELDKKTETIDIIKVILKKELTCSIYKT